jgi:hypothetical protein
LRAAYGAFRKVMRSVPVRHQAADLWSASADVSFASATVRQQRPAPCSNGLERDTAITRRRRRGDLRITIRADNNERGEG